MPFATTENSEFVFLGGTIPGEDWRAQLIPLLKVNSFNPVVEDWTEEAAALETKAKESARMSVFVITPHSKGMYSVAELTELAVLRPKDTVVCFLDSPSLPWTDHQVKSNTQILALVKKHGAVVCNSLKQVADAVNSTILPVEKAREWAKIR